MRVDKLVSLYGTGGHANVVLDAVLAEGASLHAVFDDRRGDRSFGGLPIRPGVGLAGPDAFSPMHVPMIVCIGHNAARADIAEALVGPFTTAVHPRALVSADVTFESGTVILHGAVVHSGSVLGQHVILNTMAIVGPGCVLDDFVHISPQASLGEDVRVGIGSHIGARAVVAAGVTIGRWCTVGAGSTLDCDIADFSTVVGSPARLVAGSDGQPLPTRRRRMYRPGSERSAGPS